MVRLWELPIASSSENPKPAARVVTRLSWDTPIRKLLHQCGWLSIAQLSAYHSLVQMFKILREKSPRYLYQKISSEFPYPTSSANANLIRMGPEFKTDKTLVMNSFRWRATRLWNQLPIQTRQIPKLSNFKQKTKSWVQENIPTWDRKTDDLLKLTIQYTLQ